MLPTHHPSTSSTSAFDRGGSDGEALLRKSINPAFDGEQLVDATHGLDRDRCLLQLGQLEQLAPSMRPARCLDDRLRFAPAT